LRITSRQKKIIEQQKQVVEKQKREVEVQKHVIEQQKELVEEKQQEIIDSITYAKRLQNAILPPKNYINKYLPDNFVLYQPKDIVAGDFYWMEVTESSDSESTELIFIAVADSTGHGVPGALVSIVCSNALNKSVKEFGLRQPGQILDKTRAIVLETFEKSGEEIKDGMDISLLCIDKKNKKITWSGANNPLWFVSDHHLTEIKPDKQPVGKSDKLLPFTTREIVWLPEMMIYLMTDGYPDQFGGPKGKKFKYKQLEELLVAISHDPPEVQKQTLIERFNSWKGDLEQVDDVTLIGIRLD
jgi:serine phosphatase RsbU (regulator of sigma subunit)